MLARLAPAALGVTAAVLLAGCGTGQVAQTANEESAVNGASATIGTIAIRDAQLAPAPQPQGYYTSGADAPLIMTIVNTGSASDKLLSVSSPDAAGASIVGDSELIAGTSVRSTEVPAGKTASPQATPSQSTPSQANPSSDARPTPSLPIGQIRITLTGLKVHQLRTGYEVPVVLTFAKAGKVTVPMPIAIAPIAGSSHGSGA